MSEYQQTYQHIADTLRQHAPAGIIIHEIENRNLIHDNHSFLFNITKEQDTQPLIISRQTWDDLQKAVDIADAVIKILQK